MQLWKFFFGFFLFSPEGDEAEVAEGEYDDGSHPVEGDGWADDPDHDDADGEGDKAHATGDLIAVVGKGLKEERTGGKLVTQVACDGDIQR